MAINPRDPDSIRIGPRDKVGAVKKCTKDLAVTMGFNVSKGEGRHAGFNVWEPTERLTKWIDDQGFDENLVLVQLRTVYGTKKPNRAGSKTFAVVCECDSVLTFRGNETMIKSKGFIFPTCGMCGEKFQIKN